jgi:hypothetical protein
MANYLFSADDSLFRGDAQELESNEDVANTLNKTPGAISYLGTAYLSDPGLVTLGIQRPEGLTLPTREVIAELRWPIGGPGVAITKGQPNPCSSLHQLHDQSTIPVRPRVAHAGLCPAGPPGDRQQHRTVMGVGADLLVAGSPSPPQQGL